MQCFGCTIVLEESIAPISEAEVRKIKKCVICIELERGPVPGNWPIKPWDEDGKWSRI
jgi:hypothetical protein